MTVQIALHITLAMANGKGLLRGKVKLLATIGMIIARQVATLDARWTQVDKQLAILGKHVGVLWTKVC